MSSLFPASPPASSQPESPPLQREHILIAHLLEIIRGQGTSVSDPRNTPELDWNSRERPRRPSAPVRLD